MYVMLRTTTRNDLGIITSKKWDTKACTIHDRIKGTEQKLFIFAIIVFVYGDR
jgi:hypothetical protein